VTTTMTWDFRNKMIRYQSGEVDIRYRYDGDGTRVAKHNMTTGESITYLFDHNLALPQLILELDNNGNPRAAYTRDSFGALIAQTRDPESPNPATFCYAFNAIGTTGSLTDASGAVTDAYIMDAWGNLLKCHCATENPFQYDGQLGYYFDHDVGINLLGTRWYASPWGRFLSFDPLPSENLYEYANDNPVNRLDPYGLQSCPECMQEYNQCIAQALKQLDSCTSRTLGLVLFIQDLKLCIVGCAASMVWTGEVTLPVCLAGCGLAGTIWTAVGLLRWWLQCERPYSRQVDECMEKIKSCPHESD